MKRPHIGKNKWRSIKYSPAVIREMKRLRSSGMSYLKISRAIPCSKYIVQYHLCPERRNQYQKKNAEYHRQQFLTDPVYREKVKKWAKSSYTYVKKVIGKKRLNRFWSVSNKEYLSRHPEKVESKKIRGRRWYHDNRDKVKKYKKRNRIRDSLAHKMWYRRTVKTRRIYAREYRRKLRIERPEEHKRLLEYGRNWRKNEKQRTA